jgi:hypothetical protein
MIAVTIRHLRNVYTVHKYHLLKGLSGQIGSPKSDTVGLFLQESIEKTYHPISFRFFQILDLNF